MLNTDDEKLVFELSRPGRRAFSMPTLDVPAAPANAIPQQLSRRKAPSLPEVAEDINARRCQLAVLVPPASMAHVEQIAGNLEKMPPKSTYFYPKLLTGLVLNSLK